MKKLARPYLETLSSSELISLADEYGVDIPDDLDRQFIIGDLLQLAEEFEEGPEKKDDIVLQDGEEVMNISNLPHSYNETKVNVLLRNPVSLFVWWDLNDSVFKKLRSVHGSLFLAVCFFDDETSERPSDVFSIQISSDECEQYVIIPVGKKYVRVDLLGEFNGKKDTLSFSQKLSLPEAAPVMSLKPGEKTGLSPIMELSGVPQLLRVHYNEYRQSFF